jgi:hypothetical protein
MFTAQQYRAKAAEFRAFLTNTSRSPNETREFRDLEKTYTTLAENEEWMAVHLNRTALAEEEEQILKCLGGAVLMRWNTVPTKLQRDLQFWGFPAGRPESVKIDHFQRTRRCYARSAAGPRVERRPRGIAAPELPRLWGPPRPNFPAKGEGAKSGVTPHRKSNRRSMEE